MLSEPASSQRRGLTATFGIPSTSASYLVLLGFLVQWPTLLTLVMFPVLVAMYLRLSLTEERETRASFGPAYDAYAAQVPRFLPRWPRVFAKNSAKPAR
jgi:hypothetical protein